jgi:hypothetical protein
MQPSAALRLPRRSFAKAGPLTLLRRRRGGRALRRFGMAKKQDQQQDHRHGRHDRHHMEDRRERARPEVRRHASQQRAHQNRQG